MDQCMQKAQMKTVRGKYSRASRVVLRSVENDPCQRNVGEKPGFNGWPPKGSIFGSDQLGTEIGWHLQHGQRTTLCCLLLDCQLAPKEPVCTGEQPCCSIYPYTFLQGENWTDYKLLKK